MGSGNVEFFGSTKYTGSFPYFVTGSLVTRDYGAVPVTEESRRDTTKNSERIETEETPAVTGTQRTLMDPNLKIPRTYI